MGYVDGSVSGGPRGPLHCQIVVSSLHRGGGRWLTIYYCNAILINSTAQSYAIIIQLSVVCTCMYQGQRGLPWQLLGRGTSSLPSPHRHLHSCQGANPSPDVGMPSLSHPLLPFCAEEQLADRKMEWLLTMT